MPRLFPHQFIIPHDATGGIGPPRRIERSEGAQFGGASVYVSLPSASSTKNGCGVRMTTGAGGRGMQNAAVALYGVIVHPTATLCHISHNPVTYLAPSVAVFAAIVVLGVLFPSNVPCRPDGRKPRGTASCTLGLQALQKYCWQSSGYFGLEGCGEETEAFEEPSQCCHTVWCPSCYGSWQILQCRTCLFFRFRRQPSLTGLSLGMGTPISLSNLPSGYSS